MSELPSISPGMKLLRLLHRIRLWKGRVWSKVRCEDCNENDSPIGSDGLCHFCAEDRAFVDQREKRPS